MPSQEMIVPPNDKRHTEHYIQMLCVLPGEDQDMKKFVQCLVIKSKIQEENKDPFMLSSQQNTFILIKEKYIFSSDQIYLLS